MRTDDEPAVLALLHNSLAGGPTGERTAEFFAWKHRLNPFGPSPALVAMAGDHVAGLRIFMPWEFGCGTSTVRAVRAVDTATAVEHRGQGLFRSLTLRLLDDLPAETALVFNTPNANSLPGYLKMGWEQVGDVPIHVGPGRPLRFARGIRSARDLTPATGQDRELCRLAPVADVLRDLSDLEELLTEVGSADAQSGRLHTRRTSSYLTWRYVDPPGLDYRAIALHDGGRLRGLAIGRPRRRGRLRELTLSEILVRPGDRTGARKLLSRARRSGMDHVAVHLADGTPGRAAAMSAGFLRASLGMTLTTRILKDSPVDPRDLASWRLSVGDLEVF